MSDEKAAEQTALELLEEDDEFEVILCKEWVVSGLKRDAIVASVGICRSRSSST